MTEYKVQFYGKEILVGTPEADKMYHPTRLARAVADKIDQESRQGWDLVSLVPWGYRQSPEHQSSDEGYFVADEYAAYYRKRR